MEVKNNYYYFQSALNSEICDSIINAGLSKIDEMKSLGFATHGVTAGNNEKQSRENCKPLNDEIHEGKKEDEYYIRDSEISWLTDQWIYDLVWPYVNTANEESGWNYDVDSSESFQFTKYSLNQFYGWHSDGGGDIHAAYKRFYPGVNGFGLECPRGYTPEAHNVGKVRKISVTINLNRPGDYEGGNLKFDYGPHSAGDRYKECVEIRPQGSIIVFPSYMYHQVTPVTRGTRYSLVLWVTGKPFK